MIEIREVKSLKERKEFLNFPLNLYKGDKNYAPPLYMDEKNLFGKGNMYYDTCDQIFYNAYKDGKIVGRIQGIIQKQYNEIHKEKRVRFSRFDAINNQEVADLLLKSVEKWAMDKGMDTACGPLGFSDMEREGLLVEGFDYPACFEETYNYEYYQKLIENNGYIKEVDWLASQLRFNPEYYEKICKLNDYVLKRYKLHIVEPYKHESKKHFVHRIAPDFFYLVDEGYKKLYGVVPFTEKMKESIIKEFTLILNVKYVVILANEENRGVAFGLCFPGVANALRESGGKLTPKSIVRLLKTLKKPDVLDLGLMAVDPQYQNLAMNAPILKLCMDALHLYGIEHLETNGNLETNDKILACWKYFDAIQKQRRRSYVKKLNEE